MDWPDKPCTRCAIWARRKCVCHCIIFPGCNPLVTVEQLQKKKKNPADGRGKEGEVGE